MLTGDYRNTLDEKGRIMFPSKLRSDLPQSSLILTQGLDTCLWLFTAREWELLSNKIMENASPFQAQSRLVWRRLIGCWNFCFKSETSICNLQSCSGVMSFNNRRSSFSIKRSWRKSFDQRTTSISRRFILDFLPTNGSFSLSVLSRSSVKAPAAAGRAWIPDGGMSGRPGEAYDPRRKRGSAGVSLQPCGK